MKTLKSILAGILVSASVLTANAESIPRPYVQTTLASDFVAPSGAAIEERCRQDWASISAKGFTFGIWQNQFRNEGSISERDYCASYNFPVAKNLTATVGSQIWDYPNGRFGDFDSVETANLNYAGKIDASLSYNHINKHDSTDDGDRVHLNLSKTYKLLNGKTKISLTPSIDSAWINNFYGSSGISQVSAGANLGISRGNLSLNITGKIQKALIDDFKDLNWGSASIGYQF